MDCFSELGDWEAKAVVNWHCCLVCAYRFCASNLSEVFSLGPVDGSSLSLHTTSFGTPPPPKLAQNVQVWETSAFFTANPGEGVLCQLMTNTSKPDSLSLNGDSTKIRCYFCPKRLWPLFFLHLNIGGRYLKENKRFKISVTEKIIAFYSWLLYIHLMKSFVYYQGESFLSTLDNILHILQDHSNTINVNLNNMAC